MERVWRGFAKEFSGKAIRYDDFVGKGSTNEPVLGQKRNVTGNTKNRTDARFETKEVSLTDALQSNGSNPGDQRNGTSVLVAPGTNPNTQGGEIERAGLNTTLQKVLDSSGLGKRIFKHDPDNRRPPPKRKFQPPKKKPAVPKKIAVQPSETQLQVFDEEEATKQKKDESKRDLRSLIVKKVKKKKKVLGVPMDTFMTAVPDAGNAPSKNTTINGDKKSKSNQSSTDTKALTDANTAPEERKSVGSGTTNRGTIRKTRMGGQDEDSDKKLNTKKFTKHVLGIGKWASPKPITVETSQKIADRFPGLSGSAEGRAIKDRGNETDKAGPQDPSDSLMPKKMMVRKAQSQLMNKLSNQLVHYRGQIKSHFKKILDTVEVPYHTTKAHLRLNKINKVQMVVL